MPYTALPDRRMPYDNDGTVFVTSATGQPYTSGATTYPSGSQLIALNGASCLTASSYGPLGVGGGAGSAFGLWFFFPEQREVTGLYAGYVLGGGGVFASAPILQGSNDTTNGLDGTWETAGSGSPLPNGTTATRVDAWRAGIVPVSFTGPKRVIRIYGTTALGGANTFYVTVIHVYGQKAAGQTPDDILYLNGTTSYAEFTAPEDFGDVPLATTTVRTFKVKNASATHTANTINLQCNDADFSISTDNVTWVTTINIASLAAGASSAVLYVRNTSPGIGSALGPRFARIVATVASYT